MLALALAGCDTPATSSAGYQAFTPTVQEPAPSSGDSAPPNTPAAGGKAKANPPPRAAAGSTKPSSTAPADTIKLSVVTQPACPVRGTPDAPFSSPGNDITIAWTVAGADQAALAVDNPKTYAAYGTYPATDQLTLSFPCDESAAKTTHTYTIWPAGDRTTSKTITVSAQTNP